MLIPLYDIKKYQNYFAISNIILKFTPKNLQKPPKAALFINLILTTMEIKKPLSDEELLNLLKKLHKEGYCVLWYIKGNKDPFTYTFYNTENEAKAKIKENKKLFKWINKTKIIKLWAEVDQKANTRQ